MSTAHILKQNISDYLDKDIALMNKFKELLPHLSTVEETQKELLHLALMLDVSVGTLSRISDFAYKGNDGLETLSVVQRLKEDHRLMFDALETISSCGNDKLCRQCRDHAEKTIKTLKFKEEKEDEKQSTLLDKHFKKQTRISSMRRRPWNG